MVTTNTCLLYGATNWSSVNILVIILAFFLIAIIYMLSNLMTTSAREKLKDAAKSEVSQVVISIFILIILAATATTACAISSSLSTGFTHQSLNPFQFSEYYVGNLSTNTGINLLTNVYSTSVTFAVEAAILKSVASFL